MYQRCNSGYQQVQRKAIAIALALVLILSQSRVARANPIQWNDRSSVSSQEFLQQLPTGSLPSAPTTHAFPFRATTPTSAPPEPTAVPAAFALPNAAATPESVMTAGYDSIASGPQPVGTGVATWPTPPAATIPSEAAPSVPLPPNRQTWGWDDVFALDPQRPDFLLAYEPISFVRSNDSVGPFSQGASMDRFARDLAGRYTVTRLFGAIEQIEFKFTGPFHWDRDATTVATSAGSLQSTLPPTLAGPFDNADLHHQSQRVRLASYELNRCTYGDELSKLFYGLRLVDHGEEYQLEATQNATKNQLGLRTDNFLAGWQVGIQLNRPLSQRLTAGVGGSSGLYGNFARGALNVNSNNVLTTDLKDRKLRLTTVWEAVASLNYRFSENVVASCGYEMWYFPSLATVADQRLDYAAQQPTFSLRTSDDQLFRGWTAGLSVRF